MKFLIYGDGLLPPNMGRIEAGWSTKVSLGLMGVVYGIAYE